MSSLFKVAYSAVDATAFGRVVGPIVSNIIMPIVALMFAVGIVVFVYGVIEMIWKGGDPDVRARGRMHMLGGIIGMVIMLSAWGIIYLIYNTVNGFR